MSAVRLYRPSNGTEGEWFHSAWCCKCIRDAKTREPDGDPCDGCDVLARTFAFGLDDPDYPNEWRYSDDGRPICTAFRWDPEDESLDPAAVVRPLL